MKISGNKMASEAPPCCKVPTVHLGDLGVHHAEEPSQQEWERVTHELEQAFSDIGCAYLTGHGVPHHLINEMLSSGTAFFKQDEEAKIRWAKDNGIFGYSMIDSERYGGRGAELHESVVFKPNSYTSPDKEILPFNTTLVSLHDHIHTLSLRLLRSLALSAGKHPDYFVNQHLDSDTQNTASIYSMNYFPRVSEGRKDVVGFGSHADLTSLTFLFSNVSDGFQVHDSAGQWLDVPFYPGTVLVMAGEFLHFHSNKKFKAAMHRVVVPDDHQPSHTPRLSLGYFLYPDAHQTMWPRTADTSSPAPPLVKECVERRVRVARAAAPPRC